MPLATRPLGRTGQRSAVLAFGAAALAPLDEARADAAVEQAIERGVDHFDVAPSYGPAQRLLGPGVARHRERIFLACKTRQRRREAAQQELERSLAELRTDRIDLYQCHAVSDAFDLERLLGPGGALEAFEDARTRGLVRFLGITGHHCAVLERAIERFPFDSVMFPLNPMQAASPHPALDYRPLLETASARGVAALAIKATARGPWAPGTPHRYTTWYEPHDDAAEAADRLRFALSHPVTAAVLPSDVRLWPALFAAAEAFEPLSGEEIARRIADAADAPPLYVESMKLALPAW